MKDLALDDFRLFQDGEPQEIKSLEVDTWHLPARDNRTWHTETSIAPSGVWSSGDLGHSFFPESKNSLYVLGYVPTLSQGGCHPIRVEVRRPGVRVFARDEYCVGQTPSDLLNGTKMGRKLEQKLAQSERGKIPLFLQAGTFRSGAGQQLVDVVIEFPWNQLKHSWDVVTGRLTATVGVLGVVYTKDRRLAGRFSDVLWPTYWPVTLKGWQGMDGYQFTLPNDDSSTEFNLGIARSRLSLWDPAWLPTRYETQLELPPGEYELRVILSDGEKFGRAEVPLTVEQYNASSLALGSVFLCNRFRDAHVAATEAAAANFAPQYSPLISKGVRVTPAGDTRFGPNEQLFAYFEIYEPHTAVEPVPQVQAHLRIVGAKNGETMKDFPPVDATSYAQAGNTTIPIAREIPIGSLTKGAYRLEVQASDSAGRKTAWRTASFTIQ